MKKEQIEQLKLVVVLLIMLLALLGIVLLKTQYQPSRHNNPGGGSVTIKAEFRGSQIVVDKVVEHTTSRDGEEYTVAHLDDRQYEFSVIHEGFWPWDKIVTPKSGTNQNINSFSILISPSKTEIDNTEQKHYKTLFDALVLPSESTKLVSKSGNVAVWADLNNIFAEWQGDKDKTPSYFCPDGACNSRINVLHSEYNIRSLAFLEDRDDVIIFSEDQGIYALGLDNGGVQNFQPIYKITIPQFILEGSRTMVVESKDSIFKLSF